ncbi:Uncharacterized protein Fot_42659 [Forsythia ovata]|uniref:Uncharacterized protein n=1 Tax=Forsythia ovata TaxID=205694 RepID=A0ABD1RNC6_9LAMI
MDLTCLPSTALCIIVADNAPVSPLNADDSDSFLLAYGSMSPKMHLLRERAAIHGSIYPEKMVDEREEQTQQASSSGVVVNEHDIVLKVLGERRGHRRAVGRVLRGTSRSHSSTTTLRDQSSTQPNLDELGAKKKEFDG